MGSGIDTSSIISVTYGDLSVQARSVEWKEEPILMTDVGRTGTLLTATIDGWIDATDMTTFQSLMAALQTITDGGNLVFKNMGVVERTLFASQCADLGPHVAVTLMPVAKAPMQRDVQLKITATLLPDLTGDVLDSFRVRSSTRSDGVVTIVQTGELHGAGVSAYFLATVEPQFASAHPLPTWSVSYEFAAGVGGNSRAIYTLTAQQQATALPAAAGISAVSGSATITTDRNEFNALTTTYSYELICKGSSDPTPLHNSLRPASPNLIRETKSVGGIGQVRLRSTFMVLAGEASGNLISWTNSVAIESAADEYEIHSYPGADPIAVLKPKVVTRATMSGRAESINDFVDEPLAPGGVLNEQIPRVTRQRVDAYRFVTTWDYAWMDDPASPVLDTLSPDTLTAPPAIGGGS